VPYVAEALTGLANAIVGAQGREREMRS
jgi:hypothetical protein